MCLPSGIIGCCINRGKNSETASMLMMFKKRKFKISKSSEKMN